jgi:aspartyl-tRNA(Asn)/glutamyl-tRNA(Gln) amidotransferase subunit B
MADRTTQAIEGRYEPVIGLEVHAELETRSKMFCACAVVDSTTAEPNTSVCEVCTGMPGTLPVINRRAVEYAIKVALALNCTVAPLSVFARKNYFYPDLPKGFQISQYELPLATQGWLEVESEAAKKRVRIRRVHLEEDTGKLFHRQGYSLVDYNRSGVPLLEIVSEPDMHSLAEVEAYARGLRSLLRYLGVNSGDMEKGVIRFEANISVRLKGSQELGRRTEIKNLNSFRAMLSAIAYEIQRQSELLASGQPIRQETLGWDEARGATVSQRGKEEAHDYRYFPEPDLPPLEVPPEWVEAIREQLPELPAQKRQRFMAQFGLTPYLATVLTAEPEVASFFEAAARMNPKIPAHKIAHWISGDLFALLKEHGLTIDSCPLTPQHLSELVQLVDQGQINISSAKAVLATVFQSGEPPAKVVQRLGLRQISDTGQIAQVVAQVLADYPQQVQSYLEGKRTIVEWFLGQVMRRTRGRAQPSLVRSELERQLMEKEKNRPAQ